MPGAGGANPVVGSAQPGGNAGETGMSPVLGILRP
jgi:hypothetical protein